MERAARIQAEPWLGAGLREAPARGVELQWVVIREVSRTEQLTPRLGMNRDHWPAEAPSLQGSG